ncbi:hypothetical protein [Haladaptatus halobius]|uniref:hypothetical protein n=1 Tax=Haladaptatus halobius TaxID=2884875 RepID=UPI001D09F2BF|nr:hypothetical protein [Haladaptatus halobius]
MKEAGESRAVAVRLQSQGVGIHWVVVAVVVVEVHRIGNRPRLVVGNDKNGVENPALRSVGRAII